MTFGPYRPALLPRNHLNQPIQLARFDPPSGEGGSELLPIRVLCEHNQAKRLRQIQKNDTKEAATKKDNILIRKNTE